MKLALAIITLLGALGFAGAEAATPRPGQPAPANAVVDAHVWGALVFATNDSDAPAGQRPPSQLADLSRRLGKVFPFKHFAILGQHRQVVFRESESWVVPTEELFMKIQSKGPASAGGMRMQVQVWRQQQVLSKSDTVLRAGSPLFIGGPKWRNGQLIFVLLLQE